MAIRARLTAPREVREDWPWHEAQSISLSASLLFGGDRRMEAENFLAPGFAVRHRIQSKPVGWKAFSEVARIWQPSRLKGIQVAPEFGTPFLAATQVFDVRPIPRKWLSIDRTDDHAQRFVREGTVLLTCSGSVGRATIADATVSRVLVSHDLLRIEPRVPEMRGWVYAYLRSPSVRAMMTSAQYGHMIKHLEIGHLEALPFVSMPAGYEERFNQAFDKIIQLRNRSHEQTEKAERLFEKNFGKYSSKLSDKVGFSVSASSALAGQRRRFEAQFHNPDVRELVRHLSGSAISWDSISELGYSVWLPTRFRRINAEDGVPFVDSSVLFEINPDSKKFIQDSDFGDPFRGRVMAGWLLLARSGQTYGINGSTMIASSAHEEKIISDHVIRIAPEAPKCRVGYLHVAMSHPELGRPRVKALPYGSSIPEIEVTDVESFLIPRLDSEREDEIADLAESAAANRDLADTIEVQIASEADELVQSFIQ